MAAGDLGFVIWTLCNGGSDVYHDEIAGGCCGKAILYRSRDLPLPYMTWDVKAGNQAFLAGNLMDSEVDEKAEYQLAVQNLTGMHIDNIDLKEVIEAFRSIGIDYSARDTRRIRPEDDNMATLIYGCREMGCSSYMKFTITHNVITRVETDWKHNHQLNVLCSRSTRCSVCHKSGHNKKTCPVEKGKSTVERYFREGKTEDLNRVIANIPSDGWTILGISRRDMIHLVSLVPLQDPDLVRTFFFFAPNDDVGVMGKKRLYAKIFRSQDGRTPCLFRDLQRLHSLRGNEDLVNMVYALIWYTHYSVLVEGSDPSIFTAVQEQFNKYHQHSLFQQLDSTSRLFTGALEEAMLIIKESVNIIKFIADGILTVNPENIVSVSQSLVPNFITRVHIHGKVPMVPNNLLCGCWSVETLIIDDNQLLSNKVLSSLKTTEIVRWYDK